MASAKEEEDEGKTSQDHWYLVDTHGQKFRLPKTMLFLGREECDIVVASQSVDKRHAVLTFDLYLNRFKVKDLSTTNGTYVNNSRIPQEEYVILSHMDSIRLGQDAMMYHIEQGSQITNHGGQLPDPHYIPSWASRAQESAPIHVHAHALAECQDCIAEQKIEHSCTLNLEPRSTDNGIQMKSTENLKHHNNKQYQEHATEYQFPTKPSSKLTQHPNGDHQLQNYQLPDQPSLEEHRPSAVRDETTFPGEDQASVTDSILNKCHGTTSTGRNTWPRKRQNKQATQISSVVISDMSDNTDSMASEAHPGGSVQTMFFVTFDDSVCNVNNSSMNADHERPSRSNRNSRPSELATVKKGTPLYGQPSWWGEVEGQVAASSNSKSEGENKGRNQNSRPTNLGLNGSEASGTKKSGTVSKAGTMDTEHVKPYLSPTYMEIPIKDDHFTEGASKDVPTPAKSVSSSLSKDSLSVSPELKQPNKMIKIQNTSPDVNPSTSFTVDFDDAEHMPKKSLNIGSSISEFVPSKIRKNFRERKTMSAKSSKESTPSKNSEERELSPLTQGKIDDIWSTVMESKGKSRQSSMQATAGTYLRSPNLEEIDRLSEFSEERRSMERDSDKKGSLKRPVSSKSPQASSKLVASSSIGPSSRSPAGAVSVSQYADPTSYLIDRMFEGGGSVPTRTDKQQSPEARMYREAAGYDRTFAACRSTEKSLVRPVIDVPSSAPATKNVKKSAFTTFQQPVVDDSEDDDDDLRIIEDSPGDDVGGEVKDDKEDKASEAGTYTIEADIIEDNEEEEARKRIDQVFGVDVESFNTDQPVIDPLRLASPGGYDNVYDLDGDGEKTPLDENGQSPVDGDADLTIDDCDYDGENSDMTSTDGVQMWVSQLTALTNQKSADGSRSTREDGESSVSKKPPQGISRKRPGTGRKLPSVPTDKSPVNSEHGSQSADLDLMIGDDVSVGMTTDQTANGRKSADSNCRSVMNSSQPRSKPINNGHSASPYTSSRSGGSVDTEVLLQDTETVMAAIQARISHKFSHTVKDSYNQDSDTDASSTVALVNGDENYIKSSQYKSPRDALAQRQKNDLSKKPVNTPSTIPVPPGKKPVVRSYSQMVASKNVASPRSTPSSGIRKSIVSDVVSRRDSMDNDSIISDVSSEAGDGHISRSSTKGKATITMTRTNKTFDLRRARVDSFEEPLTPKSVKSSASSRSNANTSVGRSQSLHSTTRNRSLVNTSRSEATSLGVQIVKKSQNNITQEKARKAGNTAANRTESGGGKQGQKLQHSSSIANSHPAAGNTNGKKESTPKSNLRITPTNKGGLAITGISSVSSRSQSQPGSRSNSPKAAEKMAWKRRKEYDARKSVAEAKSHKTKDGSTSGVVMRPKPSASSNIKRRMIRSASYTNSAGLSLGVHNSVSSSQDLLDRRESYDQHEEFRRAFIPFHNSLRSDRSTHSADEDDILVSNSTQDIAKSLVTLLETPSAFTPPPNRNKPVSPEITPPSKVYLSLRRRTLNIEGSSLAAELQVNGFMGDMRRSSIESPPQTSYNSLIVSSVYQLSLKLKTSTDKTLSKLREQNRVSLTPSPIDDFLSDSSKSEMTAWKTANQELAGTLKNLRKLERHVQMMNTVIFPDADVSSELSSNVPASRQVKQKLLEDIERKFGFQPIDYPHTYDGDLASPEMEEFSGQF